MSRYHEFLHYESGSYKFPPNSKEADFAIWMLGEGVQGRLAKYYEEVGLFHTSTYRSIACAAGSEEVFNEWFAEWLLLEGG